MSTKKGWRNIYKNAELAKKHTEMYASNPVGIARPNQDRVLQAFFPVVDRTQPVFYNATSLLEAQRAIRLKDEMGFKLALGNLEQGWSLKNKLDDNVTLFMSLKIPDEPASIDDDASNEVKQLAERRLEFYKRHMNQFDQLTSDGIVFGFSTLGVSTSKIKKNMIQMQDFGFDSTEALAALTTNAAELLGISDIVGTIETGKIGNLVITTGPYFNSDSNVKIVFVEGRKYTYEIKQKTPNDISSENSSEIIGTWEYSGVSTQGVVSGTIVFTDET